MNESYDDLIIRRFLKLQEEIGEGESALVAEKKSRQRTRLIVNFMVILTGVVLVSAFLVTPIMVSLLLPMWLPIISWITWRDYDSKIESLEQGVEFYREMLDEASQEIIRRF